MPDSAIELSASLSARKFAPSTGDIVLTMSSNRRPLQRNFHDFHHGCGKHPSCLLHEIKGRCLSVWLSESLKIKLDHHGI